MVLMRLESTRRVRRGGTYRMTCTEGRGRGDRRARGGSVCGG